jgi:hypothetical protein
VNYRREKQKSLTPTTIKKQLTMLATMGPDTAAETIQRSITNGWTGLFPPDGQNGTSRDFAAVQATVLEIYSPDLRNASDVETALTPEQFYAVKAVGLSRIADARGDTKALAAEYSAALGDRA